MFCKGVKQFQSTLPRRSDISFSSSGFSIRNFNPRSREGATLSQHPSASACRYFNPRSREGATRCSAVLVSFFIILFQSTLPRRSDVIDDRLFQPSGISIHAPAKERQSISVCVRLIKIFQSTLPRRSDDPQAINIKPVYIFQSTLPRRSDKDYSRCSLQRRISIHAPAKERLVSPDCATLIAFYFNPRSREGATIYFILFVPSALFQSTLPRRSDAICQRYATGGLISIHAPAKERHYDPLLNYDLTIISIHAPAKERQYMDKYFNSFMIFQSTLPRRSDHFRTIFTILPTDFNPRSREGAT